MKYVPLFILIQLASAILALIGIPLCAILSYGGYAIQDAPSLSVAVRLWHWPRWAKLWDNREDGVRAQWFADAYPEWSAARLQFEWTALRNPCNNLRFVRGVSKIGRPLWRKTWRMRGSPYYAQAGWNGAGFPVLSWGFDIHASG